MCEVGGAGRQHHFHVAGQLYVTRSIRIICDTDSAQLCVVFRRDDHFHARHDSRVGASELRFLFRQRCFVSLWLAWNRMIAGGPNRAAANVAQVAEGAPVITSSVLSPAANSRLSANRVT